MKSVIIAIIAALAVLTSSLAVREEGPEHDTELRKGCWKGYC